MSTAHIPMFAQVNKYFDKATPYLDLSPGLLSQYRPGHWTRGVASHGDVAYLAVSGDLVAV